MQLAQRISLPVRAALAANCADTPLAGHFLYRGDAALFSGVHRLRRDRFERLCGNVTDVMAQHGKLAHFEGLDVGDENSAGFREIYEFIVAHWEEIALLLRHRIRVDHARRLLQTERFAVGEIGFMVGFQDQSHFGKVFRKFVGVTPQAFRAALQTRDPLPKACPSSRSSTPHEQIKEAENSTGNHRAHP